MMTKSLTREEAALVVVGLQLVRARSQRVYTLSQLISFIMLNIPNNNCASIFLLEVATIQLPLYIL
jgi:hypothetical protein